MTQPTLLPGFSVTPTPKPVAKIPPPPEANGYSTVGLKSNEEVLLFFTDGKTQKVSVGDACVKYPAFKKDFDDTATRAKMWPPKVEGPSAGTKLGAVEQKSKPVETSTASTWGYDLAPEQMPATGPLLKKFGTGNEKEAGAYLRLFPYPTAKTRPGLGATQLKAEQETWKKNVEDKDVPALRKEMREKEIDRELKDYEKLGISPDVALGRMQEEGKIEWKSDVPMPKTWPKKSEAPIKASTLKVKDGWDVGKAQQVEDKEKVELEKTPSAQRTELFKKQTQRLEIYHAWSEQMKKENGWSQEQCDQVIAKLDGKAKLSSMEPEKVAGYFFKGKTPDAKLLSPEGKLDSAAQFKAPSIDGKAIRFDQSLPKYAAATPFEPLTESTIDVHKETVPATAEAKSAAGGQPTLKVADVEASKGKEPAKVDAGVVPPELKGSKWAGVFAKHLPGAVAVVDTIYESEGKGGPSASADVKDEKWALPGASEMNASSDPKVEDALSFERNRMRAIGFGDKDIAEYQSAHAGRSLDEIQASFPPLKGKSSWAEANPAEKSDALKSGQAELKEYKLALGGEAGRMKVMGFTPAEIKEYQRQNSGRTKDQIGRTFPDKYVDGTKIPDEDQKKKVGEVRGKMKDKMIDDTAQGLMRLDPKLSPENAKLMAAQMYRERMGKGASEDKEGNLDGMIAARKDVENDLHFISENPDRIQKLKSRTAVHEANLLYDDVRDKSKGDKGLEKTFAKDEKGQENIELFAASHGIDMTDPAQVSKFRKEGLSKEKLAQFKETYAEAPKGQPENKARAELVSKYKSSPSGSETREKPDFSKITDPKQRAQMEVQFDSDRIKNDWQMIRDNKMHEWDIDKEKRQENRDIAKSKRDQAFQLAFAATQHEMQKDQATHQAMLGLFSNVLGSTANNLQQATLQKLQSMDQLTAQLVLQSQITGKDILMAQFGKGGRAA